MKNAMSINDMEKRFGSVEFEGEKYILIDDAYIDGPVDDAAYFAYAVKAGEAPDDDRYLPLYTVEWEIINPATDDDESQACDWENPVDVRDDGATINLEDGHIF